MSPPKTFPFHRSQSPASLPRGNGVSSPLILRRVPMSSNWSRPPPTGRHTSCRQSGPRLWSLPSTTSCSKIKERGIGCFSVLITFMNPLPSCPVVLQRQAKIPHIMSRLWTAHAHVVVVIPAPPTIKLCAHERSSTLHSRSAAVKPKIDVTAAEGERWSGESTLSYCAR